ncbi:MAG: hypothetical protein IJW01_00615 [Paludibacteraceae bacterium]|nr:hypothetical protein [Paludibacteraceae bacterium]
MDSKNIIIPAGLLYYSYSSNEELKAIIKQQQEIITAQGAILNQFKSYFEDLKDTVEEQGDDINNIKDKLTPDREAIREYIKCSRFVFNVSGFADSSWQYAIDASFYNSMKTNSEEAKYANYVIKAFTLVDGLTVTIPGGTSYTFDVQGSRLASNGDGLNEFLYPETKIRINPLVSNKSVLMLNDRGKRNQFKKELINYWNNKKGYKTKILTYADSRFNAILINDAVRVKFKVLIENETTGYTLWVTYDIKASFYYIKALNPRNVGTEIDIPDSSTENKKEDEA